MSNEEEKSFIKIVQRKPLTWAEKTQIPQLVAGLKTTLINMFAPKVTLQYPDERPVLPPKYRGMPVLVKDLHGRTKCVACQLCEFVCPPQAIRIVPTQIPENLDNTNVEKIPKEFEINMLRCIYCGLCEEVCPEEAIFLQDVFSISGTTREEFVFNKEKLLEMGGTRPDSHMKWEKKRDDAARGNLHH